MELWIHHVKANSIIPWDFQSPYKQAENLEEKNLCPYVNYDYAM